MEEFKFAITLNIIATNSIMPAANNLEYLTIYQTYLMQKLKILINILGELIFI